MTERPPTRRAANAGYLLISPAILGAAVGFGIGALLGVPGLMAIVGVFIGLIGGFFLVHARFRDL
jgi:F0F1-type ATP synthase assembly protein I